MWKYLNFCILIELKRVWYTYFLDAGFVSGKLEVEWYIKVKEKDPWILSVGFSQNYKCSTLQQTLESSNLDIIRKPKKCPYKKGGK